MENGRGCGPNAVRGNTFNKADLSSIQGENRRSYDMAIRADGSDVVGKQHRWSCARAKPISGGVDIKIVEGDQIGFAAACCAAGCQSEHDIIVGTIGRGIREKGKFSRES